jgi:hypothetical protein
MTSLLTHHRHLCPSPIPAENSPPPSSSFDLSDLSHRSGLSGLFGLSRLSRLIGLFGLSCLFG